MNRIPNGLQQYYYNNLFSKLKKKLKVIQTFSNKKKLDKVSKNIKLLQFYTKHF